MLEASRLCKKEGIGARLLLKLEYFNPAGSVKDRVAVNMLKKATESGLISEGAIIIEPTSGNTGIGLAAACVSMGYKAILVMPDTMSVERRNILKAYGAELVLTEVQKYANILEALSTGVCRKEFNRKDKFNKTNWKMAFAAR